MIWSLDTEGERLLSVVILPTPLEYFMLKLLERVISLLNSEDIVLIVAAVKLSE